MALPFADVTFSSDRRLNSRNPVKVHIRQREYRHDVAVVTINYEDKTATKYAHGMPVVIEWGWLPDQVEYFHGYVHHTETVDHQQQHRQLEVYCIGASYAMKNARYKSYKKMRAHEVAASIAKDHHLSLTYEHHEFLHSHLSQGGRSDWQFLVWLAKRVGYTVYCTKTDVVFTRRVIDRHPSKMAPTFRLFPGRHVQRGAIYGVRHKVGEAVPGTQKKTYTAAVVTDKGKKAKAKGPATLKNNGGTHPARKPVFTAPHVRRPARSAAEAQSLLDGQADLHRFTNLADATVSGDTRVHQGSTVRFTHLDGHSDGYWYVGMVDHFITREQYYMDLELGRDTLGDAGLAPPVVSPTSGKPVVTTGCDVGVDTTSSPPPDTTYNPIDDCAPVEVAVAVDAYEDPLGDPPPQDQPSLAGPSRAVARARAAQARRRPRHSTSHTYQSASVKLTLWRAKYHVARRVRR